MRRIFISSVQKEFAAERRTLRDYIHGDPLPPELRFTMADGFVITLRRKPDQAFAAVGGTPTGEVTGEVGRVVIVLRGEMKRTAIQAALSLRHEDYFREACLIPALNAGLIEMTIADKPKHSRQKYRLTKKGRAWLAAQKPEGKK